MLAVIRRLVSATKGSCEQEDFTTYTVSHEFFTTTNSPLTWQLLHFRRDVKMWHYITMTLSSMSFWLWPSCHSDLCKIVLTIQYLLGGTFPLLLLSLLFSLHSINSQHNSTYVLDRSIDFNRVTYIGYWLGTLPNIKCVILLDHIVCESMFTSCAKKVKYDSSLCMEMERWSIGRWSLLQHTYQTAVFWWKVIKFIVWYQTNGMNYSASSFVWQEHAFDSPPFFFFDLEWE